MHHYCAQVRAGGIQLTVVAGAGLQHSRPTLLLASPHADPHATLPHDLGTRLTLGASVGPPLDHSLCFIYILNSLIEGSVMYRCDIV